MSAQVSFWKRVGNMFRTPSLGHQPANGNGNGHGRPLVAEPGAASLSDLDLEAAASLADEPTPSALETSACESPDARDSVPDAPAESGSTSGLLSRWGRRQPTVAQMRDGYQRVIEMMDALQEHFHKQDQRNAQLGRSVDRMVGILEQLAQTGHTQQEHIRSIAENVSESGKQAASMSAALGQLPRSLQLQTDVVRDMLRQIETSQESDTQLRHSLQQLSSAVEALNASSAAQVQTLERLDSDGREQKQALTVLVHQQGRRFVVMSVIAAAIFLAGLAGLAAVLWSRVHV